VSWLVQRELATAGQLKRGNQPPARIGDGTRELDSFGLEPVDGQLDVVAHEVELLVRVIAGMGSQFGWREGKDRPPGTSIDRGESHHVAKERADTLWVRCEDDRVSAGDHAATLLHPGAFPLSYCNSTRARRRAGLLAHRYEPKLIGLQTRQHTGWLQEDVYAAHTEDGFRAPANKTVLLLANGFMARRGLKEAHALGRG
jgi:hypothetical protein